VTDTDFDLDDEPVLTAEGEVAAAICGHQIVMRRGDALTADMLDEFRGFVQEELAAFLEERSKAKVTSLREFSHTLAAYVIGVRDDGDRTQMRLG
jgi:hypothetical protein